MIKIKKEAADVRIIFNKKGGKGQADLTPMKFGDLTQAELKSYARTLLSTPKKQFQRNANAVAISRLFDHTAAELRQLVESDGSEVYIPELED